jgi:translation initiation factor 2 beta subunit (eIF-2beta)/eIF-5
MSRVNIPSSITDSHYRYTRPIMKCVQESRLNGVKTNIRNLEDVAFALRVPPNTIIKFFCAEVGSNHVKDSVMMGHHDLESLDKHLEK